MPKQDLRRTDRRPFRTAVDLSWTEASDELRFTRGRCVDISGSGLRLEVDDPVPARALANVRIPRLHLGGTASIRHVRRVGMKYTVGLQMSQRLSEALSEKVQREQRLTLASPR